MTSKEKLISKLGLTPEQFEPVVVNAESQYDLLVEKYIRERYTVSQELALLRQKDTKPDEYAAYYAYAEECKERAKAETGGSR